jgi:hypothetical protein
VRTTTGCNVLACGRRITERKHIYVPVHHVVPMNVGDTFDHLLYQTLDLRYTHVYTYMCDRVYDCAQERE